MNRAKTREALERAIGKHGGMKLKLDRAAFGYAEAGAVNEVCDATTCAFGAFLQEVEPEMIGDARYEQINALHNAFHESACDVAGMIRQGEGQAALNALDTHGVLQQRSKALTEAMLDWYHAA